MNTPLHPFRALSGLRRPPTAPSSLPLLFPRPSNPQHQQRRTIRSILKPPPRRTRYVRGPTALTPSATLARRAAATPQRTGLLARKKGMAALFDPDERAAGEGSGRGGGGHRLRACTVLQVDGCMVVGHKTRARDGYWAVQVGCEAGERGADPAAARTGGAVGARRGVGSAMRGVYARRGLPPRRIVAECRVRGPRGLLPLGTPLVPSWFVVGQVVDTRSRTKGKGFQGGMKRHGFKGQPASHGVSLAHRSMGSVGGGQGSGSRVHPGKKMPGRMGGQFHTIKHLKVLQVDDENGILVVNGAVSGPRNTIVKIFDSKFRPKQVRDLHLPMTPAVVRPTPVEDAKEEPQLATA